MTDRNITTMFKAEMDSKAEGLRVDTVSEETVNGWAQQVRFSGLQSAQEVLILRCRKVIWKRIKDLQVPRDFVDDCAQAGVLAVLKAANSYQPELGRKFTTWAYDYISTDIKREWDRLNESRHHVDFDSLHGRAAAAGSHRYETGWENIYTSDELEGVPHVQGEEERAVLVAQMRQHIGELPPRQRELMLHLANGMSRADAAREMGISQPTVLEQYRAALKTLRKKLAA